MSLRFVPPAGVPISWSEIVAAWKIRNGPNVRQECFAKLGEKLAVRHVLGAGSCRTALWMVLKALSELRPGRDTVALPAYTCFSVAAAVVRAGLKIHPLDISSSTLDLEPSAVENLPSDRLLCVITANMFGFPSDVPGLQAVVKSKGAFLVDDAAQALGAKHGEVFAGTAADVGVFSLGRGKALPALTGGLIVTNRQDIADALRAVPLNGHSALHDSLQLAQLLAYSTLLNPRWYWLPNAMPFLNLGVTEYDPGFEVQDLGELSCGLLGPMLNRMDELNGIRNRNAEEINRHLGKGRNFTVIRPAPGCLSTSLRLPVLMRDSQSRDSAVAALRKAGFGASAFYPSAICDIPDIAPHMAAQDFHCPQAEDIARRLLTLPCHPYVTGYDSQDMARVLTDLDGHV